MSFEGFDPTAWAIEKDNDVCYLSLSSRIDCYCTLDRIDYEWAKQWLWCHSYGSGSFNSLTWTIQRPDSIYARRSVRIDGFLESGRPRYGNCWLHREILARFRGVPDNPELVGDHIDGNSLNNCRYNLRWATKVQNARNKIGSLERQKLIQQSQAGYTSYTGTINIYETNLAKV